MLSMFAVDTSVSARAAAAVAAHYNEVGRNEVPNLSKAQAQTQRASGEAHALKVFHNEVKLRSIQALVPRGGRLLDLCCGRGGDIPKWKRTGLSRVVALDISEAAIEEANRRYEASGIAFDVRVDFQVCNDLGRTVCTYGNMKYDAVTCFFAIQYFCAQEEMLHKLLATVATNLKPGGFFIGACPDGRAIMELLGSSGESNPSSDALTIERKWTGTPSAFGSQCHVAIRDTVTQDTSSTQNIECLVFETVLTKSAAKFGLIPVSWQSEARLSALRSWNGLTRERSPNNLFRRFKPRFDKHPSLFKASALNVLFVFCKQS
jgi:mRNA (guanine-N7-)-methyltransferase